MGKPIVIPRQMPRKKVRLAEKPKASDNPEKLVLGYREAYEFLGVSESAFRKIKECIPHRKHGKMYFFSRDTLIDWVNGKRLTK